MEQQVVLSASKKTEQGADVELKTFGVVREGLLGKVTLKPSPDRYDGMRAV